MEEKKGPKKQKSHLKELSIGCLGLIVVLILIGVFSTIGYKESKPQLPPPQLVKIAIKSEIVKRRASGNYRYFFYVKNLDSVPFGETVEIGLLEENDIQIHSEEFKPNPPIPPKLQNYCYVDAEWGPFGWEKFTIRKFSWRVRDNNYRTLQEGKDEITTKFENLYHY